MAEPYTWGSEQTELTRAFSEQATRSALRTLKQKESTRDYYVQIDSGQRDPSVYSNRVNFRVQMPDDFRHVIQAELLSMHLP